MLTGHMLPGQNVIMMVEIVRESFLYSMVNIGSVTSEIFLIYTNIARTNVAWTNVTMTVEIYSICSQEQTFKVLSKSYHL